MVKSRRYPIRVHITTAFTLLILLVGGSVAWVSYQRTAGILEKTAAELMQRAALSTAAEINRIRDSSRNNVRMLAASPHLDGRNLEERLQALPEFAAALRNSPEVASLYFGDYAGNYFQVRNLPDEADRKRFSAPAHTRFVVQSIDRSRQPAQAVFLFYDDTLRPLGRHAIPPALRLDPRERPWFRLADRQEGLVRTDPYLFFTTGQMGYTLASRTPDGRRIVGEDMKLDTVNLVLARHRMTPCSRLLLMDARRRLIGIDSVSAATDWLSSDKRSSALLVSELKHPALAALGSHALPTAEKGERADSLSRTKIADETWHLELVALPLGDAETAYLGAAVPDSELLVEARQVGKRLLALTFILLLASVPVAVWLSRRIAQPLSTLVRETEAIRHFDLDSPIRAESFILEVNELASTLRHTKETLSRFIDIISRVTNEADFSQLLPDLLQITTETARAEGGLLFMLSGRERNIQAVAGLWGGSPLSLDSAVAEDFDGFSIKQALETGRSISKTVSAAAGAHFGLPQTEAVSVPLFTRGKEPIGVLVLLNREPIDPVHIRFIEALSGFAAVSLETRELIAKQKALFESFLKTMANSIDAKSPYTGNHCARVPEAVRMLAEAACAQTEGAYADFSMSPEEWESLRIAAWLHDCGKVTTPEFVVDKATKLETLYDRIHEIRMRFEVLKRDAEIECLRAIATGAGAAPAQAERDAALKALDDDFAFVATCNEGGEYMAAEHLARLQKIAERTWLRTLDDRLGISDEERKRKNATAAPALPVREHLISDRPEHRIARPASKQFDQANPWGFTMQAPELLYDRGELKNLMIARGTLGEEERFKINEHIIQTIVMLSELPFPSHLSQVPEIAGGHHERMDGKGYPRGLTGAEMSPLARMMAIADVFEALTASDRPYKRPKPLSQALEIMKRMAEEGHIDPELFGIFVRSGACLRYAQRFLDPSQQDITELEHFLPQYVRS